MIDARWNDMDVGLFIDITTLRRNKTADALGTDGAMMVKDKHHYMYDDIFPLRDSVFEGVAVKVPFAYTDVLIEEYGADALTKRIFYNFVFDAEKGEWIGQARSGTTD
ncbi:mannosyltransferase [Saxophila tyrrhenica]|uniref:Mannosyltransferase n=1 Tax=Saxophila tyrrhenica TaxID=1690608 RepID=A0AAV9P486_9PEZI|nr:mannosyltransferase [Saxophila tyrrhenica]